VTCALECGDIQRTIFAPDSYSELFFLNEATASLRDIALVIPDATSATESSRQSGSLPTQD
jgi:4-hydroxyphenylpyruvate dioxygenase-like putative hemolysin